MRNVKKWTWTEIFHFHINMTWHAFYHDQHTNTRECEAKRKVFVHMWVSVMCVWEALYACSRGNNTCIDEMSRKMNKCLRGIQLQLHNNISTNVWRWWWKIRKIYLGESRFGQVFICVCCASYWEEKKIRWWFILCFDIQLIKYFDLCLLSFIFRILWPRYVVVYFKDLGHNKKHVETSDEFLRREQYVSGVINLSILWFNYFSSWTSAIDRDSAR